MRPWPALMPPGIQARLTLRDEQQGWDKHPLEQAPQRGIACLHLPPQHQASCLEGLAADQLKQLQRTADLWALQTQSGVLLML